MIEGGGGGGDGGGGGGGSWGPCIWPVAAAGSQFSLSRSPSLFFYVEICSLNLVVSAARKKPELNKKQLSQFSPPGSITL